jgi:flagellar hook assembly protein FlgD
VKNAFFVFTSVSVVVLSPFLAGAVTWQMDSSPFTFPAVSVLNGNRVAASQTAIKCRFDAVRGIVAFSYDLPATAEGAKLKVYNTGGVMVKRFDLRAGSSAVQWNTSGGSVAPGIYMASLKYGNLEKKIPISIVK